MKFHISTCISGLLMWHLCTCVCMHFQWLFLYHWNSIEREILYSTESIVLCSWLWCVYGAHNGFCGLQMCPRAQKVCYHNVHFFKHTFWAGNGIAKFKQAWNLKDNYVTGCTFVQKVHIRSLHIRINRNQIHQASLLIFGCVGVGNLITFPKKASSIIQFETQWIRTYHLHELRP